MKYLIPALIAMVLISVLLTACGGTAISQQDLTNARQTSYQQGYTQGLAEGNSAGYSKGYSEGYTAAATAILAVWPAGYPAPVISAPVFKGP